MGNTSSNGCFPIVMLVFAGVTRVFVQGEGSPSRPASEDIILCPVGIWPFMTSKVSIHGRPTNGNSFFSRIERTSLSYQTLSLVSMFIFPGCRCYTFRPGVFCFTASFSISSPAKTTHACQAVPVLISKNHPTF